MKVTFKNLGPIKEAELVLNDLTIIAGPNNTGKTYITYALYGLLKKWDDFFFFPGAGDISFDILENGSSSIPQKNIEGQFTNMLKEMKIAYSQKIEEIFSDSEGNLTGSSIDITIDEPIQLNKSHLRMYKIGDTYTLQGEIENDAVILSLTGTTEKLPPHPLVQNIVNIIIGRLVFAAIFPRPFIATAERVGISLFYKELDATKNMLVEELQKYNKVQGYKGEFNPIEFIDKMSARYAFPIRENIQFTRAVGDIQESRRNDDFKPALDKLKEMMGGYFKQVDKDIRFISKTRENNRFDIPLFMGSTSARELSDLYFFLAHIAEPGMIMMIDEPESHLNPGNQVQMARLLALCVNAGLKVFITTHSDYLVNELNNLIMLSHNFEGKKEFLKKNAAIYSEQDFLKPEAVNAYICNNGTLSLCEVDKKGMNITSFDETIDEINRVSDELDSLTDEW